MRKYIYPAIFHPEEEGILFSCLYCGCFSQGDSLEEAYEMPRMQLG